MMIELPLASLALEEKLQLMESLWDDLCRQDNGIESPSWHKDILAKRESAVAQGTEQLMDWEAAKRMLRNHLP
jgi:hypothetical protein